MLKFFIAHVTTQYDGLEWTSKHTIDGKTESSAENKIKKLIKDGWFTHEDTDEIVANYWLEEIPYDHYVILSKYI